LARIFIGTNLRVFSYDSHDETEKNPMEKRLTENSRRKKTYRTNNTTYIEHNRSDDRTADRFVFILPEIQHDVDSEEGVIMEHQSSK